MSRTAFFSRWALCCALAVTLAPRSTGLAQFNGGPRAAAESTSVELNIGEQRVMSAQGVKTYSEGVKGIVDVRLTGDASRFVIIGVGAGTTTLLLLMVDGSERIVSITVRDPRVTGEVTQGADPLAVSPQASIRLDLYFVQVNRTNSMDLGINVPPSLGYGTFNYAYNLSASALVSKTAVVGTEFLPTLDMAQAKGWAKIQRHVAVITTNGTQANFDSGGEFNALNVQGLTSNVVRIKYGTTLGIRPRYDAESGRIELAVSAEVADLTPGAPLPGRTRSALETMANLALGESLSVAGLVAANEEQNRGGIPYLSQIPILGLLFGKQASKQSDTENLVFISPSVVEPLKHARAKEFLSNAMREYDDFSGQQRGGRFFPGTRFGVPAEQRPAAGR